MTIAESLFSEQKRAIHAGNRDRNEFNGQEHAAHDSVRSWRREDEIHAEKLWGLRRWCLPWRKQDSQDEHGDHPIEYREIELIRCRGRLVLRSRPTIRSIGELPTTLDAETVDLRL
jgi:hypothetical protein